MILTMLYVHDPDYGSRRDVITCERHRALALDAMEWAGFSTLDVREVSAANNATCDFADRGGCA